MAKEIIRSHYSMRTDTSKVCLLNSNLRANLGHLFSDLLGFFLRDSFLNRLRGLIDDGLGLLQPQTGQLAHDLDDVDLVRPYLSENGVKFSLLFYRGSGRGGLSGDSRTCGCGNRSSAHTPLLLQGFGQLNQLQYIEFLNFGNNGIYRHG